MQAYSPSSSRKIMSSIWMLLGCAFCLGILTRIVQLSINLDGGVYATLARNLAQGQGSAWALHFSNSFFNVFAEHPPLMMWLEAVCFTIFGDSIAVEKGFSLLTFFVSSLLLYQLWKRMNDDDALMQQAFPFALLLLLFSGRVSYGYANGLLENLLTIFSLSAVLLILIAYNRQISFFSVRRMGLIVTAGLFICLSMLTKGPVGLFPLTAPGIYWLIFRKPKFSVAIFDILLILLVIGGFLALLYSFTASREGLERYLTAQLLPSLRGDRGSFGGGYNVVRKIIGINGYSIILVALAAYLGHRFGWGNKDIEAGRARRKRAVFLLLVGISASFPLALSPRVTNFYFNPSLFFYSTGFCLLAWPAVKEGLERLKDNAKRFLWFSCLSSLLISFAVVTVNFGEPGEDEQAIHLTSSIHRFVCHGETDCKPIISACDPVWTEAIIHTYMQRWYKISIAKIEEVEAEYVIADESCRHISGYSDTTLDISPYFLLQRQ